MINGVLSFHEPRQAKTAWPTTGLTAARLLRTLGSLDPPLRPRPTRGAARSHSCSCGPAPGPRTRRPPEGPTRGTKAEAAAAGHVLNQRLSGAHPGVRAPTGRIRIRTLLFRLPNRRLACPRLSRRSPAAQRYQEQLERAIETRSR